MRITPTIKPLGFALLLGLGMASTAAAQNPLMQPNNTWISISGTVEGVPTGETFVLDYGAWSITVEMDDWDKDPDALFLKEGDEVTVYGWIDDELFETRTIEANSVYVDNLDTYFYASGADEGDFVYAGVTESGSVNAVGLRGTVTGVNGRKFTLNTEPREITVDTTEMSYNPMDEQGFQKIRKGDLVSVVGVIQSDLYRDREVHASNIVTLLDKSRD